MSKIRCMGYNLLFWLAIFIDRITKYFVMYELPDFVVNQFLSINYMINRGISWGLLHYNDHARFMAVNILIGIVIALLVMHIFVRIKEKKMIVGETLVLAGALSNFADRFLYGGVVDFLAFSYQAWSFPVFNVADMFIVGGVGIIIILQYRD